MLFVKCVSSFSKTRTCSVIVSALEATLEDEPVLAETAYKLAAYKNDFHQV